MTQPKLPSNENYDALTRLPIESKSVEENAADDDTQVSLKEIVNRLQKAVIAISRQCSSYLQNHVDRYLLQISPSQIERGDSEFPFTVQRHVSDSSRCRVALGRGDTLCFHIGNAILAYYDAVDPANRDFAVGCLEVLEDIANVGLEKFRVHGNVQEGFYLDLMFTPNRKG